MNADTPNLMAGTARVDITPPGAVSMGGYGQRAGKVSRGVHDPLFAKALFLTDGRVRLLLITADLISLPDAICKRVLNGLIEAKVAREAEICITASHTHSGPDVDERVIVAAPIRDYLNRLAESLITAGKYASAKTFPAFVKMATGKADFLLDRRQTVGINMVDERVLAIEVDRHENGSPLAVLFGVGCHAVCLGHDNLEISADFPGYAQRLIEESLGVENALFVNLTEGNVIPSTRPLYDSLDTRGYKGGSFEDADRIGRALAREVLDILSRAEPVKLDSFRVDRSSLKIRPAHAGMGMLASFRELRRQRRIILQYLPEFSRATVFNLGPVFTLWRDASEAVIAKNMSEPEMRSLMSAVSKFLVMAMKMSNPAFRRTVPVAVQTIELNDYRLVALPGEVLVEVGRDWRKRNHPFEDKAFIISLANGFTGYMPHPRNFTEDGADFKYETIMNALEQEAALVALNQAQRMVKADKGVQ
jgi:hypothetical protein